MRGSDWLQLKLKPGLAQHLRCTADKYIFPGHHLPSLSQIAAASEKARLIVGDVETLRLHYAHTLREWLRRFTAAREAVVHLYDECQMNDLLAPDLKVLFVGFNPSLRSGDTGHHYAGRGNQFWRLLHEARLTERQLKPEEDRLLTQFGLGSTNLVARATRTAAELDPAELKAGAPRIAKLVRRCRPAFVAYTGKGVYLAASGRSNAPWGLQALALSPPAQDFVLPSPSGLVRMTFEQKLQWYSRLKSLIAELPDGQSGGATVRHDEARHE